MPDFLSVTLSGHSPQITQGETANLKWQWLGAGVLMLTPHGSYTQSVVLSAGIHGNETAPIEIINQLVAELLLGELPLAVRVLVILGNPPAIIAGERYLIADINRMFGGRHQSYSAGEEPARAAFLEQVMVDFLMRITNQYGCIMIYTPRSEVPIIPALVYYPTSPRHTLRQCCAGYKILNWMHW